MRPSVPQFTLLAIFFLALPGTSFGQERRVPSRRSAPPAGRSQVTRAIAEDDTDDAADPAPHAHGGTKQRSPAAREAGSIPEYYPNTSSVDDVFESDELAAFDSCGMGSCSSACAPFGCGLYVRPEYLLWGIKGMHLPPLVTTGNPNIANPPPGVINEDGSLPRNTAVLFGNGNVNSNVRSGGRITFGTWINSCWALEGQYFALGDQRTRFQGASTAAAPLFFPFFDESSNGLPATFNCPDTAFDITAVTRFQGAGVRVLRNLCCWDGCGPAWWDGCPVPLARRVDLLVGYRFLRLDDALTMRERCDLRAGTMRDGVDIFDSTNQFHGVDLGTMMQFRRGRWSLDLLSKVGIGNTRSVVAISGVAFQGGVQQTPDGSLLAVSTNSGRHIQNNFSMAPELGATLGYQINPCLRFTCGYSFLYWCGVYRAGDQIDQHINPNLWPPLPLVANTAGLWPQYPGRTTDFWAQGVSFGFEGKW